MLLKLSSPWTESLTPSLTSIQRMSVMCLWACWPANRTKVSHSTRCSGGLDVAFTVNHLRVFHRIWQGRRACGAEWVQADFYSRLFPWICDSGWTWSYILTPSERRNSGTLILVGCVVWSRFEDRLLFQKFTVQDKPQMCCFINSCPLTKANHAASTFDSLWSSLLIDSLI